MKIQKRQFIYIFPLDSFVCVHIHTYIFGSLIRRVFDILKTQFCYLSIYWYMKYLLKVFFVFSRPLKFFLHYPVNHILVNHGKSQLIWFWYVIAFSVVQFPVFCYFPSFISLTFQT